MTIFMSEVLIVTNRSLCREPFAQRLEKLASARPKGIILREKDLPESAYLQMAREAMQICGRYQTRCILHTYVRTTQALGAEAIHLPMEILRGLPQEVRGSFPILGASCHSAAEAAEAEQLGCTYITAGHIFETDCKKGLPGRGLDFLRSVCETVSIPVYAIGGITPARYPQVKAAGAQGACLMSQMMCCQNVKHMLDAYETEI